MLADDIRTELEGVGLPADTMTDVGKARAALTRPCYMAFVVDVALPRGTGYQLVAELRREGRTEPILLLGSPGMAEDLAWVHRGVPGLASSRTQHPAGIADHVLRTLRHETRDPTRVLRYGDIVIDRIEHRVCRGGVEVDLTPSEYGLLEKLVLNAEHVVGHDELAGTLDNAQASNATAVHMVHLRRKLDANGEDPLIRTVRGRGYVLKATDLDND